MLTKAEIQRFRSLSGRRERLAEGVFVAEGVKLVSELCGWERPEVTVLQTAPLTVQRVLCTEQGAKRVPSTAWKGAGVQPEVVSNKEMERISFLKTPSDMWALVEMPRYSFAVEQATRGLVLALDGVQDPGNMGTILRLADWFGIREVICSETTADCFNPKVVQATMGAIARVRVHYLPLEPVLRELTAAGGAVYGTFLDGETIYEASLCSSGVIVMGSEGQGVSSQVAACVTHRLYIPPYPAGVPTSESLNVATATAIVCSEFRRR